MTLRIDHEPLAGEGASTVGRLTILQARTNPDLAMGRELLKKTGSGNLFMVFGEPDIQVRETDEGRLTLEIHGWPTALSSCALAQGRGS